MEDCPGLYRWAQCNHRVLTSERGRQAGQGVRIRKRNEDDILLALKVQERAGAKDCRQPLAAGKGLPYDLLTPWF